MHEIPDKTAGQGKGKLKQEWQDAQKIKATDQG